MAIHSALSSLYYRTANLMMDMYSEDTIWKAIPLMKTEDTLRQPPDQCVHSPLISACQSLITA